MHALGRTMSILVVQEQHQLLNLVEMDSEKMCFLDAPISQGELFGDAVMDFAQQFSTMKKQTEDIRYILPEQDDIYRPQRARSHPATTTSAKRSMADKTCAQEVRPTCSSEHPDEPSEGFELLMGRDALSYIRDQGDCF